MKTLFRLLSVLSMCFPGIIFSQKIVNETQVELFKKQRKEGISYITVQPHNKHTTVLFNRTKSKKVKGEVQHYQQYEIEMDENLKIVHSDYKDVGKKKDYQPNVVDKAYRYYLDVQSVKPRKKDRNAGKSDSSHSSPGTSLQNKKEESEQYSQKSFKNLVLVKFDEKNRILLQKDYPLCEEDFYRDYRTFWYEENLFVLAQWKKKSIYYLQYLRIDAATLKLKDKRTLNLLDKKIFELSDLDIYNDHIYLAGKELTYRGVGLLRTEVPFANYIFKLDLSGQEVKRVKLQEKKSVADKIFLERSNNGNLLMVGEIPHRSGMKSELINFIFNENLDTLSSRNFSYEKMIRKSVVKETKKFNWYHGRIDLRDAYFLNDGSFYILGELFEKRYVPNRKYIGGALYSSYNTEFEFFDAIVLYFDPKGSLSFHKFIRKGIYRKRYEGFIEDYYPPFKGLVDGFLLQDKLLLLYNPARRGFFRLRFGLNEIIVNKDGTVSAPVDFSAGNFGRLENTLEKLDENYIVVAGYDERTHNLWMKKIELLSPQK